MKRSTLLLALLALAPLGPCLHAAPSAKPAEAKATSAKPKDNSGETLYDGRLARVAQAAQDLMTYAAGPDDRVDRDTVARRFHALDAEFQTLLHDTPDRLETYILYGKFLDFFGDRENAQLHFALAQKIDPDVAVVNQYLGTFHAEEGNFGEALAYYLRATELEPKEPVYAYALAELLFTYRPGIIAAGILSPDQVDQQAFDYYRRAAELAPDRLDLQFRYGEAFYDAPKPDWELALAHWQGLQSRADLTKLQADAVRLHRARVLGELFRYEQARDAAREVVTEALAASRDAVLAALDEAEARGQEAPAPAAAE